MVFAFTYQDRCRTFIRSLHHNANPPIPALQQKRKKNTHKLPTASPTLLKCAFLSVALTNNVPEGHPNNGERGAGFWSWQRMWVGDIPAETLFRAKSKPRRVLKAGIVGFDTKIDRKTKKTSFYEEVVAYIGG